MISAPRLRRRRSIGSFLAVALVAAVAAAGVGLTAGDAGSVAGVDFTRLAGGDRYATAATIATNSFGSASIALLVSGERFPDAVAASYLAGVSDAPVLLSTRDAVPAVTIAALQELGVDFVVVVGGTDALSAAVPVQLTNAGIPNARVAGGDRYQTASALAFVTGPPTVGSNENARRTAILASGEAFPDALAAGPIAYREGFPLLLTTPNGLHPAAEQALTTLGIQHVIIVGGTGAVGTAVTDRLTTLNITVERLAGGDRYATARAIAGKAIGTFNHTAGHVDLATGERFPDALAGGPHAGARGGVIILTPTAPAGISDSDACGFLVELSASITEGHVLGGEQAVAGATEAALESCAAGSGPGPNPGVDPNIDYAATPATATVTTLGVDGATFQWTFTGITEVVDVALLPCFAVTPGSATTVADDPIPLDSAFPPGSQNSAVGRLAPGSPDYLGATYRTYRGDPAGAAVITGANGPVNPPAAYVDGLTVPPAGVLTVTVKATASDCAVPLVFADPGDDDTLALGADERPTDKFGVGGAAVATLGDAPADRVVNGGEVAYLDKAANFVVLADGFRYAWGGTNDRYFYDTFSVNQPEFELALSRLDQVGIGHASGLDRFEIDRDVPGVATGVSAQAGDFDGVGTDSAANDVMVTWAAPNPVDGLVTDYQVDVYRCAPGCVLERQVFDHDHEPASAAPPANEDSNNDNIDDDVDRSVVVEDLSAGSYRFVVQAMSFAGHRSIFGSRASGPVNSAAAPGSPKSIEAVATEGGGANVIGVLDPGDTLRVTFDQTMKPPDGGDGVTIRDPANRIATLTNGVNATFLVTGAVLTIQVTQPVLAGTVVLAGLQATGSTGVTDPEGNEWDLPGSSDRTFG